MKRFELVEGSASKFWEIGVTGCEVRVRFGRIGTHGQVKVRTVSSEVGAQKAHDGLILEKTVKGYREVAVAAGSPLPVATPSSPAAAPAASAPAAVPLAPPLIVTPTVTVTRPNADNAAAVQAPPEPAAVAALPAVGTCSPEQLPPLLRDPPWLQKVRAADLPTLDIPVRALQDRIVWSADERAWYAAYPGRQRRRVRGSPTERVLITMHVTAAGRARLMAGTPLQVDDVQVPASSYYSTSPDILLAFEGATVLALWNSYPAKHWSTYEARATIQATLAVHGEAAVPGLVAYAQVHAEDGLLIAQGVDSASLVPVALRALRHLKKGKALAMAWLRAQAQTALTVSLPVAFGRDKALRDDAQFGVRWLVDNGFELQAREVAASYGADMVQALQALLDVDPLLVLPTRMPKLPAFFVASALRAPVLRERGGALPASAVEHIGSILAISKPDLPYAGLAIVQEACTPASLAAFAWDLFEAWTLDASPNKEVWAFTALGLLGNDDTAHRLAPRIREWPGQSAHQRAVVGLDLLAAIGSDVALMHLNGIASKLKFKALQDRAKEKIADIAEARGLTSAELGDRLVPDLGLDEQGTLRLDFGPRQFSVGFDETLKPFVKDTQGVRLKDLPKPLKSDDAALAEAATERYKQLKKDAKAIASLQVIRLEMSMVERRRWTGADFKLFFLGHPLMRHLAARVVWGVYGAQGQLTSGFRVSEDRTLADANDAHTDLPDDATVGLVHVIEMPLPLQTAFGQIFADYQILQPFKQLGRETYTLTPDERQGHAVNRFEHKTVSIGGVMGLLNRGWQKGEAQDAGWIGWFTKSVGDKLEVQLELDPGTVVGEIEFEPKQRIPSVVLLQADAWGKQTPVSFERLDPITVSEVLRDADLLAPVQDP